MRGCAHGRLSQPRRREPDARECVPRSAEFGGHLLPKVLDAQYWMDRAEQTRLQAEEMTDPAVRCQMLQVAAGYRRLAQYAGQRDARKKSYAQS
jgi:hypothetical protein